MAIQNAVSSVHQGGLGHLPGDQSGYMTFPSNALDAAIAVRDPAVGSMAAADAALIAALPGKILCGVKDNTGAIAYTFFILTFI